MNLTRLNAAVEKRLSSYKSFQVDVLIEKQGGKTVYGAVAHGLGEDLEGFELATGFKFAGSSEATSAIKKEIDKALERLK